MKHKKRSVMESTQFYNRIKKNISKTHTPLFFFLPRKSLSCFQRSVTLRNSPKWALMFIHSMSSVKTSHLNGVNAFLQVKWEEVELEANTGKDSREHEWTLHLQKWRQSRGWPAWQSNKGVPEVLIETFAGTNRYKTVNEISVQSLTDH